MSSFWLLSEVEEEEEEEEEAVGVVRRRRAFYTVFRPELKGRRGNTTDRHLYLNRESERATGERAATKSFLLSVSRSVALLCCRVCLYPSFVLSAD